MCRFYVIASWWFRTFCWRTERIWQCNTSFSSIFHHFFSILSLLLPDCCSFSFLFHSVLHEDETRWVYGAETWSWPASPELCLLALSFIRSKNNSWEGKITQEEIECSTASGRTKDMRSELHLSLFYLLASILALQLGAPRLVMQTPDAPRTLHISYEIQEGKGTDEAGAVCTDCRGDPECKLVNSRVLLLFWSFIFAFFSSSCIFSYHEGSHYGSVRSLDDPDPQGPTHISLVVRNTVVQFCHLFIPRCFDALLRLYLVLRVRHHLLLYLLWSARRRESLCSSQVVIILP